MAEVIFLPAQGEWIWAVMAQLGKTTRVAAIHPDQAAATVDRQWRERQVRAYRDFLRQARQPPPRYTVARMRRADLPRNWQPLPALGFLRGRFA